MTKKLQLFNLKNVLLDRDGTIIEEKHYLCDPKQVEFYPESIQALSQMQAQNLDMFVVTNQSGLGRGYFKLENYWAVEQKIYAELKALGIVIKDTVFCPHTPKDNCNCRKPAPGLWQKLKTKYNLNPEQTIMIGDKISDIEFGLNSNLALSILVLTGHGKDQAKTHHLPLTNSYTWSYFNQKPLLIAADLNSAWQAIRTLTSQSQPNNV